MGYGIFVAIQTAESANHQWAVNPTSVKQTVSCMNVYTFICANV